MATHAMRGDANNYETETGKTQKEKLIYINNIRWLLTIFVVMVHIHVTYSGIGLWYYKEPGEMGPLTFWSFIMYQCGAQAFLMGLFFLIAGYFTPGSYAKRGFGRFLRDRFIRLGIPTLVYMLAIHPVTVLLVKHFSQDMPADPALWYGRYITSFAFLSNSGPMWFTFALFIFTAVYALLRNISSGSTNYDNRPLVLSHKRLVAVIMVISAVAFLLRTVQPAGVSLFNKKPGNFMQIGFFGQYIIAFILGIYSRRHNLLDNVPYKFGKFWLILTLAIGLPLLPALFIGGGIANNPPAFFGGLHWQSAAYATWESFMFVGISIGLLALFGAKNNSQGRLRRFLSDNAFGVYVFHPPILVALSLLFNKMALSQLAKTYTMVLIVVPICFLSIYLLRKIPLARRLFS